MPKTIDKNGVLLQYDSTDRLSILRHAKLLWNKSLSDIYHFAGDEVAAGGKGDFGLLVESRHFDIRQNSLSEPDFEVAGVELKTHPIEHYKKKVGYRPKERLVFSMINYMSFARESEWNLETSSFWRKNRYLLLMTYLYEEQKELYDYIFKIIRFWEFPEADLKIITDDWNKIVAKIKAGRAHQISGGDTDYLEACTKGGAWRDQPFSDEPAISRAFALKPAYLRVFIESALGREFSPVVKSTEEYQPAETFEDVVLRKVRPFIGTTLESIAERLGVRVRESKDRFAILTDDLLKGILGIRRGAIEEFEKGSIVVRTCHLDENGKLAEHVSFPAFRYKDLIAEAWEDSDAKSILESRFFFVFIQDSENGLILHSVKFWTMPTEDVESVKSVWQATVDVVRSGRIIERVSQNRRYTFFPHPSDHRIAHVRPHASKAIDTDPLPVPEATTGAREYTKHSFWLNKGYVMEFIR